MRAPSPLAAFTALALSFATSSRAYASEAAVGAERDGVSARPTVDDAAPLPPRDIRWHAAAGAMFDSGTLPRPAAGVSLGLDLRRGILAATITSSLFLPNAGDYGARVGLVDLVAAFCTLGPLAGGAKAGICAVGGIGLLHVESDKGANRYAARPALGASLRLEAPLTPWLLLRGDVGALFGPLRPELRATADDVPYVPAVTSLRAALSVGFRFW